MSLHVGHLTSLYRYPVKSMLGESLPTAEVDHHGLPGDRGLAFLDEETGKVVSAKYPARWRAEVVGQVIEDLLAGKLSIAILNPLAEEPLTFEKRK